MTDLLSSMPCRSRRVACATLVGTVVALSSVWAAPAALAKGYTDRPVKIVVPYPPGSTPDALARIVDDKLGETLGQVVTVENKPGAGGMLGARQVSTATPDGTTLLMFTAAWPASKIFVKKPLVSFPEGLTPLTLVAEGRAVFMASKDLPAASFNEMITYARSNPGKLNFATTGLGDSLLYFHTIQKHKGVKIETIQYKGSAEYIPALVSNDVQLAWTPEYSMLPLVKDGKMKPLAVTGDKRSTVYPDVPSFAELGLPMVRNNWFALFGPKGMSPQLAQQVGSELARLIQQPDVRKRIEEIYFEPVGSTPEVLRERLEKDYSEWSELARSVGIQPQ
jgi:tripartite-type tricarboxylate transporter receptor subunit TctC